MLFLSKMLCCYRGTGLFIKYYPNNNKLVHTKSQRAKGFTFTNSDELANMNYWLNKVFEMAVLNVQHLRRWNVREWHETFNR